MFVILPNLLVHAGIYEKILLPKADKGDTLKNNPFIVAGCSLLVPDHQDLTGNEELGTSNHQLVPNQASLEKHSIQ